VNVGQQITEWQAMFWTDAQISDPDRLFEEDEPVGVDEEHLNGVKDPMCSKEATVQMQLQLRMSLI
jgi:hypothetical protein